MKSKKTPKETKAQTAHKKKIHSHAGAHDAPDETSHSTASSSRKATQNGEKRELTLPSKQQGKSESFEKPSRQDSQSNAPSVAEEASVQNHTIPPMTIKSLSQMVAEYSRNREVKECRKQASLENFNVDLDKFVQEMKEEYNQPSKVPGDQTKPMNYEIFQKYFDFQPHILQSFYPQQLQ